LTPGFSVRTNTALSTPAGYQGAGAPPRAGPGRRIRRGLPRRRAGGDPGRGQVAPVAQPGRARRQDDGSAGEGRLAARTLECYAAVHELLQAGESLHEISRVLSLSRPTMRRFARPASRARVRERRVREE